MSAALLGRGRSWFLFAGALLALRLPAHRRRFDAHVLAEPHGGRLGVTRCRTSARHLSAEAVLLTVVSNAGRVIGEIFLEVATQIP